MIDPERQPISIPSARSHGQPVLIIGAGRGGTAMLEMFLDDEHVEVVGIVDATADAPGLALARRHGIAAFTDVAAALAAAKTYTGCLVYNLTHDDAVAEQVRRALGYSGTSGAEAKLIWQMVTRLKRVKEELQASQHQFKAIFESAMDGILIFNAAGQVCGINPAAEQIFGYPEADVLGKDMALLIPRFHDASGSETDGLTVKEGVAAIAGTKVREFKAIRRSGEGFDSELSISQMDVAGRALFIGIVRDITDRKRVHERIEQLAHHDFLTKLPNRALFKDRLERAISMAERNQGRVAVLFLDLDGFKAINDELGHDAGDILLCEIARRITGAIRHSDTVARAGGDEFTVILNEIGSQDDVSAVAGKIRDVISLPFRIAGRERRIGASIGIAIFPDHARAQDELLRAADGAMYAAKQGGKNAFRFHGVVASDRELQDAVT
jgi:diguanylate cyclase (GGDEF)-like protein/PAS domain S-box-containing protein